VLPRNAKEGRGETGAKTPRMPRTFATFASPGTLTGSVAGEVLVGRLVANTEFLKALARHGSFERFLFLAGENGDAAAIEQALVAPGHLARERVVVHNLVNLPLFLASGEIDVLHLASHIESFLDCTWLRDRHARAALPVTSQIHSLSYPRHQLFALRALLTPPGPGDAIFCSSQTGREALVASLALAREAARARLGAVVPPLACELPVVPLGVEVEALRGGDRAGTRRRLGLPEDAFVVLAMGRFTEYDKMDLFPLVQAFQRALGRARDRGPMHLVLAGARQGTRTPEMLQQWSELLGVADHVKVEVDFPAGQKRDLLAAADVFVSPCDNPQETFGLTVVEAMAAGLPVIASDYDGYKDTVTPEAGIRVPTRWLADPAFLRDLSPILYERPLHLFLGQGLEVDLAALESALVELYLDAGRRAAMGRAAARRAESIYDWRAVIPRYEAVWRGLAARPFAPAAGAAHPLGMDYGRVFGHYPTAGWDPARVVRATEAGRAVLGGFQHLIYPELRQILSDAEVLEGVRLAGGGLALGDLVAGLALAFPAAPAWRGRVTAAWLLKHGLVG